MGVPTALDPNQSIYIVSIEMGSQFRGTSKDISEYVREITYKFSLAKRQDIGAARQRINVIRNAGCFKFFKNYVTNDIGKEQLTRACSESDAEMKKIDPTLHVSPIFFKLDTPALSQGNILTAMTEQLRQQVHERVLTRIQKVIEEAGDTPGNKMSKKTKNALLKMLDKTAEINVLNDEGVTTRIEQMKAQINADKADALITMRDEILSILDESSAGIELIDVSDASAETEPATQHDPDEQDYKPVPLKVHDIEFEDETKDDGEIDTEID